ncbi:Coenzyme F420 hydrogenase/dehydrogenase, beta subunit C-terminal domain [Methylophilus methylotrophus]|uniref:Coenzyme F420 hydrogenase/dehydrogenase, beta subunit C-terminal domain n=1 Tax=Methylophilus methylotrophus TaxID=17 RepID=UPI0003A68A1E|nr:Coenzyme F420 hydrogenase/dehydrogenase, beta subunit C-terminal domain [Methylophilus methylotrophus]
MNPELHSNNANVLNIIKSNGYCTGCGICASIAEPGQIEMQISSSGFLRPVEFSPISRLSQQLIQEACPGVHLEHSSANTEKFHPIWGPLVNTRTAFSLDQDIRRQGSSGGVVSALCTYLLEAGIVDFVAQTAVSPTDPLKNILQKSRSREDVLRAAGSRYAPSAPLENIREMLETGERFAFVGKPCDVAALRHYLDTHPEYYEQVKLLISFMCAGVPSIKGTHEVLEKMGADKNKLASFRYRGDGWPGKARAIQNDGQIFEMDYNSSWGEILGRRVQFRCKLCPDGTGEFADVVCADAWYGKDGYPDFTEREGRSMLLTRTKLGEELVNKACEARVIDMVDLPVADIAKMQPYQALRKKVALARLVAAGLANMRFVKFKRMGLFRASFMINPISLLRNAVGTYRRTKVEKS